MLFLRKDNFIFKSIASGRTGVEHYSETSRSQSYRKVISKIPLNVSSSRTLASRVTELPLRLYPDYLFRQRPPRFVACSTRRTSSSSPTRKSDFVTLTIVVTNTDVNARAAGDSESVHTPSSQRRGTLVQSNKAPTCNNRSLRLQPQTLGSSNMPVTFARV